MALQISMGKSLASHGKCVKLGAIVIAVIFLHTDLYGCSVLDLARRVSFTPNFSHSIRCCGTM
jgi:hypothetical protein